MSTKQKTVVRYHLKMLDPGLATLRRSNLQTWLDEHAMTRSDMASKMGTGRAYVSNLFKPDRYFGEKAARKIEEMLGMPKLHLDQRAGLLKPIEVWGKPEDLAPGIFALVPRVAVSLSAGNGELVHEEQPLPPLAFREDWLRNKGVTSRANLRVCEVTGESMEPYLHSGDVVLIDIGQTSIKDGEVYAIRYGSEVRIKRLFRRMDGSIRITSDNQRFPEDVATPADADHFFIIGAVLWRGG